MRMIAPASDGTLCRMEPINPVQVLALVWSRPEAGCIDRAVPLGETANLREAERMAVSAGFAVKRKPHFVDVLNGIHIHVFQPEKERPTR